MELQNNMGRKYEFTFRREVSSSHNIDLVALNGLTAEIEYCAVGTKFRLWTQPEMLEIFGSRSGTLGGQGKTLIFLKDQNKAIAESLNQGNSILFVIESWLKTKSMTKITLSTLVNGSHE